MHMFTLFRVAARISRGSSVSSLLGCQGATAGWYACMSCDLRVCVCIIGLCVCVCVCAQHYIRLPWCSDMLSTHCSLHIFDEELLPESTTMFWNQYFKPGLSYNRGAKQFLFVHKIM